jgi:hypothetical protein
MGRNPAAPLMLELVDGNRLVHSLKCETSPTSGSEWFVGDMETTLGQQRAALFTGALFQDGR